MCHHSVCAELRRKQVGRGVGVLPLVNYHGRRLVCLLGKERGGRYRNTLNLCAGMMEDVDKECYINCACRELREEFKIFLNPSQFESSFTKLILEGRTPVFVLILQGLTRREMNAKIYTANANQTLPACEREMAFVDWVGMDTYCQIDNKYPRTHISSFALEVMQKVRNFYN